MELSLGIDLGLKDLEIFSDGTFYKNINKTYVFRKIEKWLKNYKKSEGKIWESKELKDYVKTKNIIKLKNIYNKSIEDGLTLEIIIFVKGKLL